MSRSTTPAFSIRRPPITVSTGTFTTAVNRTGTPTLGRNAISLEEWDRKAPLSNDQLQSITLVREQLGQRPLPQKFLIHDSTSEAGPSSRPATPTAPRPRRIDHLQNSSFPRSNPPSAPASPRPNGGPIDPLHPTSIITPQQFHEHFSALTLSTEQEQDSLYRDHLSEIIALREKCDLLVRLLREGQGEVSEMLKCLAYVEERSESLRGACEDLLEEQTHLLTHTSQLAHRLTFFTFLETAQRMLNTPSNNLVMTEGFLPMVKRLDECLLYLGEHRDFKDSELYLIRYQQCMTRSMTLIKNYFVGTIRSLGQEVGKRLSDKSLSETASQALLYTKFTSLSSGLRPLIAELEYRVRSTPDELTSLLNECHSAWVSTRQGLMGGRVAGEIGRMEPDRGDLVDLTRAGCSYLKHTCLDEFHLYKHFFLSGEPQLYGFLETLCDYLYDHIRPRILHEPSLEVLCGVCTVLQALMVQDVSTEPTEDDDTLYTPQSTPGISPFGISGGGDGGDYFTPRDDLIYSAGGKLKRPTPGRQSSYTSASGRYATSSMTTRQKRRKPLSRLHTEILLKMVLQDAQTRLVFRAQALLRADVEYYVAKEADLAYPAKLKASGNGKTFPTRSRELSLNDEDEDDDEPAFLSLPPVETQESWYPSLRTTLWVLSCLYTYIDTAVFEDLAQEAIITCRISLTHASETYQNTKRGDSMDAKLFLVRHLLILKEMMAGLELGRRSGKREWSGITDFLRSLLDNAGMVLGYARGSLVKSGQIALDAKMDIDKSLKTTCESLISVCTQQATSSLQTFLTKAATYPTDLSSQPFATPSKILEIHDEFRKSVKGDLENWVERLRVFLEDEETVRVLVPPAQNSIVDAYRQYHDLVRAEYDFSTAAAIMTPTALLTLLSSPGDVKAGVV